MGSSEVEEFLTHLATQRQVAPSTHKQALAALLFLYRQVLDIELPWSRDPALALSVPRFVDPNTTSITDGPVSESPASMITMLASVLAAPHRCARQRHHLSTQTYTAQVTNCELHRDFGRATVYVTAPDAGPCNDVHKQRGRTP
jgi:hypothetical protein